MIGSNIIIVINKCWLHDKSCGMSRCTKRFNHFHFHHHRRYFLLRVYFLTFTQNSHRTQSQSLTDVWQHDQDLYSGWPGRVVGARIIGFVCKYLGTLYIVQIKPSIIIITLHLTPCCVDGTSCLSYLF